MTISTPRRLGALALLASIAFAACSSSGASTAPSAAATTAPTTAASAPAASAPAASSAAPSAAAGPTPPTANVTLQGAGATFPAPLYMSWFQTYNETYSNIQIDYQANFSKTKKNKIKKKTIKIE